MGDNKAKSKAKKTQSNFPWKEILAFLGVIIAAYIGYLGVRSQIEIPIQATQTAEARVIVKPTQAATLANLSEYTIVYPSCNCYEYLDPYEKVLIRLRWGEQLKNLQKGEQTL